jgi:hypothetical protein
MDCSDENPPPEFPPPPEKKKKGDQQKFSVFSYSVFHRFRQAKFAYGGSILSSRQFLPLPWLPQKMELASKVVSKLTQI